jgi:uroporphyrinogen III methyltransferase/synthase
VARSRPQPSRIAANLRRLGAEVLDYPELRAVPAAGSAFDKAFAEIGHFAWIVFTSPAGVRHFWSEMERRGLDARSIAGSRIAAFGAATEKALRHKAITPDVATRTFDVDRVVGDLDALAALSGTRVLFPREGNNESPIATGLRQHGAVVDEIAVFVTERVATDRASFFGEADAIVLPSSTAVVEIADVLRSSGFRGRIVAMGPSTAQTALALGLTINAIASDPSVRAVVRAVRECLAGNEGEPSTHELTNLATIFSS